MPTLSWLTREIDVKAADGVPYRLAALMRCRFILARRLKDKVLAIRQDARHHAYQVCLFSPEALPEVSLDQGFRFFDGTFAGVPRYRGSYRFSKHFLGDDQVPAFDGNEGTGDEFKAAQQIDAMPKSIIGCGT